MMRRVLSGVIVVGAVLVCVPASVGAQGSLPGVVSAGRYAEGTLAVARQPGPEGAATGSVYGVGAWPTYTSALADGPGRDLVVGACSICHSTTYITMQPALPAAAWAATVDKMIKVFGASISEDSAKQITQYLQTHYTPETRR